MIWFCLLFLQRGFLESDYVFVKEFSLLFGVVDLSVFFVVFGFECVDYQVVVDEFGVGLFVDGMNEGFVVCKECCWC